MYPSACNTALLVYLWIEGPRKHAGKLSRPASYVVVSQAAFLKDKPGLTL